MTHIVLDIDGTLINENNEQGIVPRPYLEEFLYFCFNSFETVSIWTAATKEWFDYVNENILKPIRRKYNLPNFFLVWTSERCSYKKFDVVKVSRFTRPRSSCDTGAFKKFDVDQFQSTRFSIKRLKKLWKNKRWGLTKYNTLILDNTPRTYIENYGNAVPIPTFYKQHPDSYLKFLTHYLEQFLNKSMPIRSTDKMDWWLDYD